MKIDIGSQLWKQKFRANFKQSFLEKVKEERVRKRVLARKSPKMAPEMTNLLVRRNQFVKPQSVEIKEEKIEEAEYENAPLEDFAEEIAFFSEEIKKSKVYFSKRSERSHFLIFKV